MNDEVLISKVFRLPLEKGVEIYKEFTATRKIDATNFGLNQQLADILDMKIKEGERLKEETMLTAKLCIDLLAERRSPMTDEAFETLKGFPNLIWMEIVGTLSTEQILATLRNYAAELPSVVIETYIINLPEKIQTRTIEKYKDRIQPKDEMFSIFYYCLGEDAKAKLRELFPNQRTKEASLMLAETPVESLAKELALQKPNIQKHELNSIVETMLTKTIDYDVLSPILDEFCDYVDQIDDMHFKLIVGRAKYLIDDKYRWEEGTKKSYDLFAKMRSRFKSLGLYQTLELFGAHVPSYDENALGTEILLDFLDDAYECDPFLTDYVNSHTIKSLIKKYEAICMTKTYTPEDLSRLVAKVHTQEKQKLIRDDYLEAIVACRKLMQENLIDDKNKDFVSLREKFLTMMKENITNDGTYEDEINLDGVFYRLVKGTLDFGKVLTTNSYRGLIYLARAGIVDGNPDAITSYLTDEQVAKIDIKPLLRWKKAKRKQRDEIIKNNSKEKIQEELNNQNLQPMDLEKYERMYLQLLCYFGEQQATYIINAPMLFSRMENLFDNLNYRSIVIDENNKPKVNEELLDFLFGRGSLSEKNTIMNKIIAGGELLDFASYFKEVCNNYEKLKEECQGVLTVKRILRHFENVDLPVEIKPNEYTFPPALKEMKTTEPGMLNIGKNLCHAARKRKYSTIPQVQGEYGNCTYKILDLKDPMALTVGYLVHDCFVVSGASHSALEHSMSSKNGRTFTFYYKGKFLGQSWVWRNGDVVCFDSVEAGSSEHFRYKDSLSIADVYKKVAEEIIEISKQNETETQRVKVVTVGKSDYIFENLERVSGSVPKPLEDNLYLSDSSQQWILAGKMPEHPRYGVVAAQYKDPRDKVIAILDFKNSDPDELDEAQAKYQSIKYDMTEDETPIDLDETNQLLVGEDWYIKANKDGTIEAEIIPENEAAVAECKKYAEILGIYVDTTSSNTKEVTIKNREETISTIKSAMVKRK